jgi:tight adherence protein B
MVEDAAEPSRTEYRRVLSDERLGIPIERSLAVVGERMRSEDVAYMGIVATLQQETGGNTAEVLDRVVHTIRERAELRRLVRTLTAQGRLGGWIVTALPLALIVLLTLTNPDYLDPMLERTFGQVILAAGFLMVGAGALVIRRIVDIEV